MLNSKQNTYLVVNLKFLLQNKQTARLKGLKWDLFGYIVMRLSFLFCLTSQHLGIQNRKSSSEELKVHLEVYNAKAYFMIWENIHTTALESEIDLGEGTNIGPGKFGKKK